MLTLRHYPARAPSLVALTKAAPDEPEWKALHRIADQAAPAMQRTVLAAVAATKAHPGLLAALRRSLRDGNQAEAVTAVLDAWDAGNLHMDRVFRRAFRESAEKSGAVGVKLLESAGVEKFPFEVTNERWGAALRAGSDNAVQAISRSIPEAVRSTLISGIEEGEGAFKLSQRIADQIGLTERQAVSVERYRARLAEQGMKPARVDRLVAARTKKAIKQRAITIAHTESIRSVNVGYQESINQAVELGRMDANRLEREWITSADDVVCPVCTDLDGKRAALQGGEFDSGVTMPPAHARCRCAQAVTRKPGVRAL
jgi:hypothetical protein